MISIYYVANQNELYHHGVLGMKWGIRRYQNKDGTRTTEGKRHTASSKSSKTPEERRAKAKAFISKHKKAIVLTGIAGAAYGIHKLGKNKISTDNIKDYAKKGAQAVIGGTKAGVKEGLSSGAKKAATTLIVGGMLLGTKKIADLYVGKDIAGQIFNANNSKKIGSFWNYTEGGRNDDD